MPIGLTHLPRPEPSAGVRAYKDELVARLGKDIRCARNYTTYLSARKQYANVDYLPIKLDIENVSRCNFACTMCVVSTWPKGRRAEDMPLSKFKELIDEQYGLVEIKLNGLGEALMQGDEYFEMIRYARSKRIWVRMTTNASLLHLRDNYKKLIDSGVNEIDISIDGADAGTFQAIRVQGNFRQVTENCAELNRHCEQQGITRAKMWTLVQSGNADRLEDHVELAHSLGFKQCVFSLQLHGWGHEELAARNSLVEYHVHPMRLQGLVALGKEIGVRVSFWDVADKFDAQHLCPWPFERAVVTSDMRTVPCCMIADPDAYEIGKGVSFMKSWTGDEYRAFRQAHIEGAIPSVCKSCYKETTKWRER